MQDEDSVLVGTVLDEACFTLGQLAAACCVSTQWIERHIAEGVLGGCEIGADQPRFTSRDLWRARQIHAIERDFDAAPELAALVADMLEEMAALRARLRRAGLA